MDKITIVICKHGAAISGILCEAKIKPAKCESLSPTETSVSISGL